MPPVASVLRVAARSLIWLTGTGLLCWCATASEAVGTVSFSRDILPILSDNCFSCHGPDEGARKAKLRLDTQAGALGAGKSGEVAVVPGDSAKSELIRRLVTADPDDVMPPPKSNRHLTSQQVELIRRWIDQGAAWGRHWAFETPRRPAATTHGSSRHSLGDVAPSGTVV